MKLFSLFFLYFLLDQTAYAQIWMLDRASCQNSNVKEIKELYYRRDAEKSSLWSTTILFFDKSGDCIKKEINIVGEKPITIIQSQSALVVGFLDRKDLTVLKYYQEDKFLYKEHIVFNYKHDTIAWYRIKEDDTLLYNAYDYDENEVLTKVSYFDNNNFLYRERHYKQIATSFDMVRREVLSIGTAKDTISKTLQLFRKGFLYEQYLFNGTSELASFALASLSTKDQVYFFPSKVIMIILR